MHQVSHAKPGHGIGDPWLPVKGCLESDLLGRDAYFASILSTICIEVEGGRHGTPASHKGRVIARVYADSELGADIVVMMRIA